MTTAILTRLSLSIVPGIFVPAFTWARLAALAQTLRKQMPPSSPGFLGALTTQLPTA